MPRFNAKRAEAFARYTVTWFLAEKQGKKAFLRLTRKELLDHLGSGPSGRLRSDHLEFIGEKVAAEGYAMASSGTNIYFFDPDEIEKNVIDIDHAKSVKITEQFERLYGSPAADDLWEESDLYEWK